MSGVTEDEGYSWLRTFAPFPLQKTFQKHSKIIPKTFQNHSKNIPKSCQKHSKNISKNNPWKQFQKIIRKAIEKHSKNNRKSFQKHSKIIPKTIKKSFQKHSKNNEMDFFRVGFYEFFWQNSWNFLPLLRQHSKDCEEQFPRHPGWHGWGDSWFAQDGELHDQRTGCGGVGPVYVHPLAGSHERHDETETVCQRKKFLFSPSSPVPRTCFFFRFRRCILTFITRLPRTRAPINEPLWALRFTSTSWTTPGKRRRMRRPRNSVSHRRSPNVFFKPSFFCFLFSLTIGLSRVLWRKRIVPAQISARI